MCPRDKEENLVLDAGNIKETARNVGHVGCDMGETLTNMPNIML